MNAHAASMERPVLKDKTRLGDAGPKIAHTALILGLIALGGSIAWGVIEGGKPLWKSYLINFAFFTSLTLGGLFFVIIQHVTRAGWSVVVRRVAEAVACNAWLMALLGAGFVLGGGMGSLYAWWDMHPGQGDHLYDIKAPYLNHTFFYIRFVAYFAIWIVLSQYFFRTSVKQDESGDPNLTLAMERRSPLAVILFALSLTFFAVDMLMSLEYAWFSTMFGVYYFAGTAGAFFAVAILTLSFLQGRGLLTESVTKEHYHDLGKLVFAFVVFWCYIAYSQYMLIWYANIPEETFWYQNRLGDGWKGLSLFLLLGHFFGPFLFLMSRWQKRRHGTLLAAAIWMLFMHWIDMFWLVKPGADMPALQSSVFDLTLFIGMGGLWVWALFRKLQDVSLVPERDPRLRESLHFENY